MAEKSNQLIVDGLSLAVAHAEGLPLHGNKAAPGLFASNASAKQAAQRCKDEGYLRVVRAETRGRTLHEVCTITEKGLAYLLAQASPREVLQDFVRALEARQLQVGELVAVARQTQAGFDALKATAEKVLQQLGKPAPPPAPAASSNGSETWLAAMLAYLKQWQNAEASQDCPLPDLYRQALKTAPALSIGRFHDGLRRLHERELIYLHPWTGPLYEVPEPPYALLIGHDIAYYASLRQG